MGDLVEVIIFSQTSGAEGPRALELEFFSTTYNGVRFFSALYVMSNIFSGQDISFQEFLCMLFCSRNQSAGFFFLKSPITPSKVK